MSKEEPRERINIQPATSVVLPSAQTSSEDLEQVLNTEKTNLQLQIIMICTETHMMQVGTWEKLRRLWRILGVNAKGQATSGVQPDIYYRRCPPSLCLAWIPKRDQRPP